MHKFCTPSGLPKNTWALTPLFKASIMKIYRRSVFRDSYLHYNLSQHSRLLKCNFSSVFYIGIPNSAFRNPRCPHSTLTQSLPYFLPSFSSFQASHVMLCHAMHSGCVENLFAHLTWQALFEIRNVQSVLAVLFSAVTRNSVCLLCWADQA